MLNVWGVTVLRSAVTRSRVFCHFLWTRRKQLFLARESFSHSFRSIHHVAAITIFEHQRRIEARRSGGSFGHKRENNWVDAEIRLLVDLWGDDQVQSDLVSSCRTIVVYRRIADRLNRAMGETDRQDRTALFLLCNAGQSMNSTRSMVYVTTVHIAPHLVTGLMCPWPGSIFSIAWGVAWNIYSSQGVVLTDCGEGRYCLSLLCHLFCTVRYTPFGCLHFHRLQFSALGSTQQREADNYASFGNWQETSGNLGADN